MKTNKRKRAAFYPYTNEYYALHGYSELIKEFDINYFIIPEGITATIPSSNIYYSLTTSNHVEILLVGYDPFYPMQFEKTYFKIIKEAINQNIPICFIADFPESEMQLILKYNQNHNKVELTKLCNWEKYGGYSELIKNVVPTIFPVNCPVVFVASTMEYCRKFEVELGLHQFLSKKGYNIKLVSSKSYGELFGVYPFPKFMFEALDEEQKIVNFNILLKSIEYSTHPDMIIVGIPGTIMKFNNTILNHFGILAVEAAKAARPDIVVLNVNYDPNCDCEMLDSLCNECAQTLGTPPICICISDSQLDTSMVSNGVINFLYLKSEKVEKKCKELTQADRFVCPALSSQGLENLANFIEEKLSDESIIVV